MKSKKLDYEYEDYEDEPIKVKITEKKRQHRNWKKDWENHQLEEDDFDEVESDEEE